MTLKFKNYHDKALHFAFLIKDEASAGAIFRFVDPWNYYFVEIDSKSVAFGKMIMGTTLILNKLEHLLEMNKWYRFTLVVHGAFFYLYRKNEDSP